MKKLKKIAVGDLVDFQVEKKQKGDSGWTGPARVIDVIKDDTQPEVVKKVLLRWQDMQISRAMHQLREHVVAMMIMEEHHREDEWIFYGDCVSRIHHQPRNIFFHPLKMWPNTALPINFTAADLEETRFTSAAQSGCRMGWRCCSP